MTEYHLSDEAKARVAKAKSEGLCLACWKPKYGKIVRGCHESCATATRRAIKAGTWTEGERIREGKLLPPNPGTKPTNPVTIEAQKAKD